MGSNVKSSKRIRRPLMGQELILRARHNTHIFGLLCTKLPDDESLLVELIRM